MFSTIKSRFSLLVATMLLTAFSLHAGGWGKTDQVTKFEGANWNGVYFDMNGLYFTASVPNYAGASMQNGQTSINGKIDSAGYVIVTTMNPGFTPPKTLEEFKRMAVESNPDFIVHPINGKKLGVMYAVDLTPKKAENRAYWRIMCTKDRLLQMGTADGNSNRRIFFFDSIVVH